MRDPCQTRKSDLDRVLLSKTTISYRIQFRKFDHGLIRNISYDCFMQLCITNIILIEKMFL